MSVTDSFDLYAWSVPWATIHARYRLAKTYTKEACMRYIQAHGRKRVHLSGRDPSPAVIVHDWPPFFMMRDFTLCTPLPSFCI